MYCWAILFFSNICCFLLVIFTRWLSFAASFTLIRRTFVSPRELVVISTTCIHSCRQPLSCVCPNCCMFYFPKFVWLARLSTSFRSLIFWSCDQFYSRIVRQFCTSVSRMQPVWKLLDCSNKFGVVWLNVELLCCFMYLSLFCLGCHGMVFWH